MKYQLTWKIIIIEFIKNCLFKTFPIFIALTLCFTLFIFFLDGTLFIFSISSLFIMFFISFPLIIGIFFILCIVLFMISFLNWKKNIVGTHELFLEDNFFVWQSKNQKVFTSFQKIKYIKVSQNYFDVKFDGIRSATIYKKWSIEGYDRFVKELLILGKEKNIKINDKTQKEITQ